MDHYSKQLYALTEVQFTRLAEQRSHDKQTQQAYEEFKLIAGEGGKPRAFFCGFSEFTILDEHAPADTERLQELERTARRYKG